MNETNTSANIQPVQVDTEQELEFLVTPYAASFGPIEPVHTKRTVNQDEHGETTNATKKIKLEDNVNNRSKDLQNDNDHVHPNDTTTNTNTNTTTNENLPTQNSGAITTNEFLMASATPSFKTEDEQSEEIEINTDALNTNDLELDTEIIPDHNTPFGLTKDAYQNVLQAKTALECLEKIAELDGNNDSWEENTNIVMIGLSEIQNRWSQLEAVTKKLIPKADRFKGAFRRPRGRGRGRGRGRYRKT